ncbi:uncharacterized protein B0T23DRAFT_376731 [Neurospora hispaniola]|uniref:Uncharacterized protein n=1 Tax=Neurospora hispaniola TaxID=588809 RepID=A0AAJ0I9P7_9PEZI|nr:hypothetical protein B0T23DRAFT_376731 [Neurospora hispaniola]
MQDPCTFLTMLASGPLTVEFRGTNVFVLAENVLDCVLSDPAPLGTKTGRFGTRRYDGAKPRHPGLLPSDEQRTDLTVPDGRW